MHLNDSFALVSPHNALGVVSQRSIKNPLFPSLRQSALCVGTLSFPEPASCWWTFRSFPTFCHCRQCHIEEHCQCVIVPVWVCICEINSCKGDFWVKGCVCAFVISGIIAGPFVFRAAPAVDTFTIHAGRSLFP